MRNGRPVFLTVSCVLVGLQAASVLAIGIVGLTLTTSQRILIDAITGAGEGGIPSLTLSIGAGVIGLSLAGLIVMLARRSRLGRWLTVALEFPIFLFGLVSLQVAVLTGFFDPFNLGFTAATLLAPALILFALIVNRGVRRYFTSVSATSALQSP
jgi:hypothetical protein